MEKNFETKQATIISFPKPRGRGRPKIIRDAKDMGTPELMRKRERGETTEALDLCLERGILSPDQHWSGVHLRWLYTLRYGAPSVRALDPTHLGGFEIRENDSSWKEAREQEYNEALEKLSKSKGRFVVMGVCIYNERPEFLKSSNQNLSKVAILQHSQLLDGLDTLVKLWGRRYKNK